MSKIDDAATYERAGGTRRKFFLQLGSFLAAMIFAQGAKAEEGVASLTNTYDRLIAEIERSPDLVARSRGYREFINLQLGLETAPSQAEPSQTPISKRASNLLIRFEISNETIYSKLYTSPTWPHGKSGVTIGIGYDIGYATPHYIRKDWHDYLASTELEKLAAASGVVGPQAKELIKSLKKIQIPYSTAEQQFLSVMQPRYIGITERALPNFAELPLDCRGALVSLVYNRGASFDVSASKDKSGRYTEMRAIKLAMQQKAFADIPRQIISMQRLWRGKKDLEGLLVRRQLEATLFRIGLQSAS